MGTEVCASELMTDGNVSRNSEIPEEKNATLLSQKPSIGPVTPDSNRENLEQTRDLSTPLTSISSPLNAISFDSNPSNHPTPPDGLGSETPKESVFDSFAPGPDKFMLAPLRRKKTEELQTNAVRRLNFACATNLMGDFSHESQKDTILSDEEEHLFFESVYETILSFIVSEHTKELAVSDSDGPRTPKSAPHLSWVAETCPQAPMKSTRKFRHIDKEICKKLEF